jgi:hypothetical protein
MHAAQQPDTRDAAPGADLDDSARVEQRGQEAQYCAATRLDRDGADFGAALGRCGEDVVLADVGLGVVPCCLQTGDGGLPKGAVASGRCAGDLSAA